MPDWKAWKAANARTPGADQFDLSYLMVRRGQAVVLKDKNGTARASQLVIVSDNTTYPGLIPGNVGESAKTRQLLIGWRGFPGKPDFLVAKEDRFAIGIVTYKVVDISDLVPGLRLAFFEAVA